MEIEQEPIQPLPDPPTPEEVAATAPDYELDGYDTAMGMALFIRRPWPAMEEVRPAPEWLARRADLVINSALLFSGGAGGLVLVYFFARQILLVATVAFLAYAFFVGMFGAIVELNEYASARQAPEQPSGEEEEEEAEPESQDGPLYHSGEDIREDAEKIHERRIKNLKALHPGKGAELEINEE